MHNKYITKTGNFRQISGRCFGRYIPPETIGNARNTRVKINVIANI